MTKGGQLYKPCIDFCLVSGGIEWHIIQHVGYNWVDKRLRRVTVHTPAGWNVEDEIQVRVMTLAVARAHDKILADKCWGKRSWMKLECSQWRELDALVRRHSFLLVPASLMISSRPETTILNFVHRNGWHYFSFDGELSDTERLRWREARQTEGNDCVSRVFVMCADLVKLSWWILSQLAIGVTTGI